MRNQCLLAASLARAGFTPVIDYVITSKNRVEEYKSQLNHFTLRLVTLSPGIEVALERDKLRPEKTVAAAWVHLDQEMKDELAGIGFWIDNSQTSLAKVVDEILVQAEKAIVTI